ncbi:MAG: hypothetical protein A2506_12330 [Elusimicrobia bacterium RIFOXYD12_FULL_66_9]|nr:MAG: hypothetical protein A2506_12330 [Elusimicrobia bacterium RIFOXYD12_FULL_66_9]
MSLQGELPPQFRLGLQVREGDASALAPADLDHGHALSGRGRGMLGRREVRHELDERDGPLVLLADIDQDRILGHGDHLHPGDLMVGQLLGCGGLLGEQGLHRLALMGGLSLRAPRLRVRVLPSFGVQVGLRLLHIHPPGPLVRL